MKTTDLPYRPQLPPTPCQCAVANISVANHMDNLRRNIFLNPVFEVQKLYDAINMAENTCGSGISDRSDIGEGKARVAVVSLTLESLLNRFDRGVIDKEQFVRSAIKLGDIYIDNFKSCAMMEE